MARVRDYAAEYATLKARAQAVGLSTRAYRRARKDNPLKYGAPSTQQRIRRRLVKFEPIETANSTPQNVRQNLARALARRGAAGDLDKRAAERIKLSSPDQIARFNKLYNSSDLMHSDEFWLSDDDYAEIGHMLYYHTYM